MNLNVFLNIFKQIITGGIFIACYKYDNYLKKIIIYLRKDWLK